MGDEILSGNGLKSSSASVLSRSEGYPGLPHVARRTSQKYSVVMPITMMVVSGYRNNR